MLRFTHTLFASFLLLTALALTTSNAVADDDTLFSDAYTAYKNRDDKALIAYGQRLKDYPLAPYLDYWLALLRLDTTDPAAMQALLARYADYPFADRLRGEWLKALGKQQNWTLFLEEYPKLVKEDAAVACYAILARYSQGDKEALTLAKPLWMVGSDQPTSCDNLFAEMRKRGVITENDVWARMRLAFRANQVSVARSVARYLSDPPDTKKLKTFDRVYENPQQMLEKKILSQKTRLGRELTLYALGRVARSQPELALELWEKVRTGFNQDDQQYAWGWLATHTARNHLPNALELFKKAGDTPLEAEQHAWKARAALRTLNWDALYDTIMAMPPEMQEDPAWRYWKAYTLKKNGNAVAANALLLPLAKEPSYYGQLAQETLGDVISAPPVTYRATEADVAAIEKLPAVQRTLLLYRLNLRWESRQEWMQTIRNMDDKHLIAAAEFAFRQEWYDLAINTADKTQVMHDFALRYPTPYRDMMQSYAKENQLDEAWVYGLIRQESRFITQARSGVGAAGLMQVMPATARWIAKRIGFGQYQDNMIHQLNTNIQFGTYYLRHVLESMNGQSVMATAAYNAGPGRAKRWADSQPMEGAIYTETIPFNETRDYVKKVMGNAQYYARRLGTKIQTLSQRLGTIAGADSAKVEPTEPGGTEENNN